MHTPSLPCSMVHVSHYFRRFSATHSPFTSATRARAPRPRREAFRTVETCATLLNALTVSVRLSDANSATTILHTICSLLPASRYRDVASQDGHCMLLSQVATVMQLMNCCSRRRRGAVLADRCVGLEPTLLGVLQVSFANTADNSTQGALSDAVSFNRTTVLAILRFMSLEPFSAPRRQRPEPKPLLVPPRRAVGKQLQLA